MRPRGRRPSRRTAGLAAAAAALGALPQSVPTHGAQDPSARAPAARAAGPRSDALHRAWLTEHLDRDPVAAQRAYDALAGDPDATTTSRVLACARRMDVLLVRGRSGEALVEAQRLAELMGISPATLRARPLQPAGLTAALAALARATSPADVRAAAVALDAARASLRQSLEDRELPNVVGRVFQELRTMAPPEEREMQLREALAAAEREGDEAAAARIREELEALAPLVTTETSAARRQDIEFAAMRSLVRDEFRIALRLLADNGPMVPAPDLTDRGAAERLLERARARVLERTAKAPSLTARRTLEDFAAWLEVGKARPRAVVRQLARLPGLGAALLGEVPPTEPRPEPGDDGRE